MRHRFCYEGSALQPLEVEPLYHTLGSCTQDKMAYERFGIWTAVITGNGTLLTIDRLLLALLTAVHMLRHAACHGS